MVRCRPNPPVPSLAGCRRPHPPTPDSRGQREPPPRGAPAPPVGVGPLLVGRQLAGQLLLAPQRVRRAPVREQGPAPGPTAQAPASPRASRPAQATERQRGAVQPAAVAA